MRLHGALRELLGGAPCGCSWPLAIGLASSASCSRRRCEPRMLRLPAGRQPHGSDVGCVLRAARVGSQLWFGEWQKAGRPCWGADEAGCGSSQGLTAARHAVPCALPAETAGLPLTAAALSHARVQYHTHDYCGIGGSASTVDDCWKSDRGCAQPDVPHFKELNSAKRGKLPGCATGYVSPYFPAEATGTIMSYCHQLSGNISNIVSCCWRGLSPLVAAAQRRCSLFGRVCTRLASVSVSHALPCSGPDARQKLRVRHPGQQSADTHAEQRRNQGGPLPNLPPMPPPRPPPRPPPPPLVGGSWSDPIDITGSMPFDTGVITVRGVP